MELKKEQQKHLKKIFCYMRDLACRCSFVKKLKYFEVMLIEYSMRNIFLEKSYTTCGRETIPRPSSKKSKLNVPLDQYSKFSYILFQLFAKLRTIESD